MILDLCLNEVSNVKKKELQEQRLGHTTQRNRLAKHQLQSNWAK
jgi:hypothetical protein